MLKNDCAFVSTRLSRKPKKPYSHGYYVWLVLPLVFVLVKCHSRITK